MTLKGMLAYERLMQAISDACKRAMYRSTVEALRYARGISEGPFKTAELEALDHPYATRHGSVQLHPFWINEQTGAFKKGWLVENVNRIKNPTPYASWLLEGTDRMLPRDYAGAILSYWQTNRALAVQRELARIGVPTRTRPQ